MEQTPYQKKLWDTHNQAHTDGNRVVKATLKEMITALENDRYSDLRALHETLPASYGASVGFPPRTRSDDQ